MTETKKTDLWDVNARIELEFTDPVRGWIAEADGEVAEALADATKSLQYGYVVRQGRLVAAKARQQLVQNVHSRAERLGWLAALQDVRSDVEHALWHLDGLDNVNAHSRAVEADRLRAYGRFLYQTDALLSDMANEVCAAVEEEVVVQHAEQAARDDGNWQREGDELQAKILALIASGAPGAGRLAELALRVDAGRVRHYYGGTM